MLHGIGGAVFSHRAWGGRVSAGSSFLLSAMLSYCWVKMEDQNISSNSSKTPFFPQQVMEYVAIFYPLDFFKFVLSFHFPQVDRRLLLKAEVSPFLSTHRDGLNSLYMAAGQWLTPWHHWTHHDRENILLVVWIVQSHAPMKEFWFSRKAKGSTKWCLGFIQVIWKKSL